MYKYTIGNVQYKSKFGKDVSLFCINPDSLKILSKEHRQAFKGLHNMYKNIYLFDIASKYINVEVCKFDGRLKESKSMKYVSVNILFEVLKDNIEFKALLLSLLKIEGLDKCYSN